MYKDFKEEEARIRSELTPLLSVRDVRTILGVSVGQVLRLVKDGRLDGFGLDGPMRRNEVTQDTFGVRITPSSLQRYLEEIKIS